MKYIIIVDKVVRVFLVSFFLLIAVGLGYSVSKETFLEDLLMVTTAGLAFVFTLETVIVWFLAWYDVLLYKKSRTITDKLVLSAINLLLGPIGSVYILLKHRYD